MTTRRGFLTGILALGAAPAIVRAENLMRLWVPPQEILTLDMLRRASYRLTANIRDDQYVLVIHPSIEAAMRELIVTGSATVIYRGEVGRVYG